MKERLTNVLAWFAFIYGGICLVIICALILDASFLFDPLELYAEVVGFGVFELGVWLYSPLIWTFLYVLDGKPHFLPWAK